MEKKRSPYTSVGSKSDKNDPKRIVKKARGNCGSSQSSSHTQFFRVPRHETEFKRINVDEYLNISESISGSTDTFHCVHGPEGKKYTEKGLLRRNLLKNLDPLPVDEKWNDNCRPAYGWEMAKKLEFLVQDPTVHLQLERLGAHLCDFCRTTSSGYKINVLDSVVVILNFLLENINKVAKLEPEFILLLKNTIKPILLNAASEVITYFEKLRNYIGFLGYLLVCLEDDKHFDVVSEAILWHLSAPNAIRPRASVQLQSTLTAGAPVLCQTVVRMLAVTSTHRFPTFLEMAFLLACDNVENCIEMMRENLLESIFYRFNPYFPHRLLPSYDISPANPQDINIKLGDSSIHITTTLSLLLVILQTTKKVLEETPNFRYTIPHPDEYAQKCLIWAYRYECRARGHEQYRITLTVIIGILVHCFRDRLTTFTSHLIPDIVSMSVLTELPPRNDWIGTVKITTNQLDVQFKKILIQLSVDFIKIFPCVNFVFESRYWLTGLMYLLDPGLCRLRAHWSPALFAEIRKTSFQALVCTIRLIPPILVLKHGLIRRLMWYIEWYSESPFELSILYWCVRLLQAAIFTRHNEEMRKSSVRDLFETHGIIIIIHLCKTLMTQRQPPIEKSQAIIALSLRLLTSTLEYSTRVSCCVYPDIKWPSSVNSLATEMLDMALYSLEKHFFISDRWLVSLLNFIWEAIIWKQEYRVKFVANNGVYKLLDLITLTKGSVQCMALALICDTVRADKAVGHLVSWRASVSASYANPIVVKRGATIASLLAAIFRDECIQNGVKLNQNGIIESFDCPLMNKCVRGWMYNASTSPHRPSSCLIASDLAGSRLPKVFALLQMLTEDFKRKSELADETYNLYKYVTLAPEDETILILCSHYLTLKIFEVWEEINVQFFAFSNKDDEDLEEFILIGKGWAKEIQRQQESVITKDREKEQDDENNLYSFLARVRLNIALDALREVRCIARSADRTAMVHSLLQDAVSAHHRRSEAANRLYIPLIRTYEPSLDDQITGKSHEIDCLKDIIVLAQESAILAPEINTYVINKLIEIPLNKL